MCNRRLGGADGVLECTYSGEHPEHGPVYHATAGPDLGAPSTHVSADSQ